MKNKGKSESKSMKIKEKLDCIYKNFKLVIYQNVFNKMKKKAKDDTLTSNEYFCLDCVYLLGNPTIKEFANFLDISAPNATYKINQLIHKGYLKKEKDQHDKREVRIYPTDKFLAFYDGKANYGEVLLSSFGDNLKEDEVKSIDKVLDLLIKKVFPKSPVKV